MRVCNDVTRASNPYGAFPRDVTAAMLVSLNKGTAAILVSPTNRPGIELLCKRFLLFWLKNVLIDHVSENALYVGSPSFRKIRAGFFFFNLPYTISWQVRS